MWLNANAQAFTFHQRVSGSYYIRLYCSRIRVLEVPNTTETDVNSRNVKLFTSNYGAGMQWVLEAVNFGRAPSYNSIETSDVGINCGGFALRMDGWVNLAYNSTIESAAAQTIDLFQHYQPNRSIRRIQGTNLVPTYSISSNEYRVALRVRENALRWDFHYMIQTNDGQWAHKSGRSPSELIGYINPSTYNWSNGYNSATIYFAVTW